jgi:hypothetical protein
LLSLPLAPASTPYPLLGTQVTLAKSLQSLHATQREKRLRERKGRGDEGTDFNDDKNSLVFIGFLILSSVEYSMVHICFAQWVTVFG